MLSKLIVAMTLRMPRWFVRWVSRRYVAGSTLDDAVVVMKRLESRAHALLSMFSGKKFLP